MQERDPFAIPDGMEIGDEYEVPFEHPKKGEVQITVFVMEGDKEGELMRYINTGDAVLLTKKSRDTATKMLKDVKQYRFQFMGNVKLVRYDSVIAAIAAAYRPIKDSHA